MSMVKFYFDDGKTKTFNMGGSVRGIRHNGLRPYLAAIYGRIGDRRLEQEHLYTCILPALQINGKTKIMNGLDK